MRPKGNFVIPALSIFISKNNRYLAQRSCLGHTVYKINSTSFWRYFYYKLSSLESQIYIYKKIDKIAYQLDDFYLIIEVQLLFGIPYIITEYIITKNIL